MESCNIYIYILGCNESCKSPPGGFYQADTGKMEVCQDKDIADIAHIAPASSTMLNNLTNHMLQFHELISVPNIVTRPIDIGKL